MSASETETNNAEQSVAEPKKRGRPRLATKPVRVLKRNPVRSQVASDALPRKTFADALRVAEAIKKNYGGNGATWEDIAQACDFSAKAQANKYFLWSALGYGLITKSEDETYKITEIGRKILAPTYEGERQEGIIKAIATPTVLSRFYSDYSGATLPVGDIFKNVLEQKYGIPAARVEETINIILENARAANLIKTGEDGLFVLLSANEAVGVGSSAKPNASQPTVSPDSEAASDANAADYGTSCFIITPIGDDGSPERKHADALLKHLVQPVLEECKIKPVRADQISRPGHITKQVVEHIAYCRLCITDLSFGNQNAHYELGIRHALKLPSVQLIRKGDKIPFDVQQGRTIIIDTSDPYTILDRIQSAKAELLEHVKALLTAGGKQEESPISMYLPRLVVKF